MLDTLPQDILIEILAIFPVKALLQLRCVSKTLCSLISSLTFVTHHLNETQNNDPLILAYGHSNWRGDYCYFVDRKKTSYERLIDEEQLECLPFKGSYSVTKIVGSCNFMLCLSNVYYDYESGFYTHRVALWNPSIKRTFVLPPSNVTFKSKHDRYFLSGVRFGFGFTTDHDYKLVKIVYFRDHGSVKGKILASVEVYSLKTGLWRMVNNDLKYFIQMRKNKFFIHFLNGACHWVANPLSGSTDIAHNVIVFFNLDDDGFGELAVPDCLAFEVGVSLAVSVYDGLLMLLSSRSSRYYESYDSFWVMKEYGDVQSWTKLIKIESTIYWGARGKFMDSLVLLNEANWVSVDNIVSKGNSSRVAALKKKEKKKERRRINKQMNNNIITNDDIDLELVAEEFINDDSDSELLAEAFIDRIHEQKSKKYHFVSLIH